jgi:Ca2+-binding RTX toxin-like protein
MATQFEIDCALMAGLSYQSTRDKINWFPAPSGWQEFSHVPNSTYQTAQSFEASAFQNTATKEIVISYAGTAQLTDWIANVALGLGFNAEQLNQAALYYLQIKAANPDATISFTGHSLGGGLAALMGVFFDNKAITFDQAPFANSASVSIRDSLVTYLHGQGYSDSQLAALVPGLLTFDVLNGRVANVTGLFVQDEALQYLPLSTLGTQAMLAQNSTGLGLLGSIDLHSQTLLSAFLQNDAFRQITFKLPELLKMVFDSALYYHDPSNIDNPERNFLENLVRHQAGVQGVFAADAMLDRFTTDLQLIAQDGGLTMANNDLTKALTAFAMQAYYDNRPESDATLFDAETGGIHFDRMDVADTLDGATGAKGYTMYFTNYLATLPAEDRDLIVAQLPNLLDWYIQAGTQAMTTTAGTQRAFMLGGSGDDSLTGGSQADLLVGNGGMDTLYGMGGNDTLKGGSGADILNGGADADLMIGGEGMDTYYIDGNDTIRDTGRNIIVYEGQVIAGAFLREGTSNTYRFLGDNNFTLTFNSPGRMVLNSTDSITFENQTSAADFANGDFGIKLFDSVDAALTFNGTLANNTMAVSLNSANQPEYLYFSKYDNDPYPQYVNYNSYFSHNFHIEGNEGNDLLLGLAGKDYISGGVGSDRIAGDGWVNGVEWTMTGLGDILYGNAGSDYIAGGWGNDLISGGDDGDFLQGNEDNDIVTGDGGDDLVLGSTGDDQLFGNEGNDILWGDGYIVELGGNTINEVPLPATMGIGMTYDAKGSLNDYSFDYQLGNASIGYGNDLLAGGNGNDWLNGGGGNDTLFGEAGNDHLDGDDGDDYLDGGDGDDILLGYDGADTLIGGAGNDQLKGENGDDHLDGDLGDDALAGGKGNDRLLGGSGNDTIFGEAGNDTLVGGMGNDTLQGGVGNDTYLFNLSDGQDTIYDYDTMAGNVDIIRFGAGIAPSDITFSRSGYNLILGVNGTTDQVNIQYWGARYAYYRVERVEFANGTVWDAAYVQSQITALPIVGTDGADNLQAWTDESTTFLGLGGDDNLVGSNGNDTLEGGTGNDSLLGKDGSDTYLFNLGDGKDTISDYDTMAGNVDIIHFE